jgi:hypothetical protein
VPCGVRRLCATQQFKTTALYALSLAFLLPRCRTMRMGVTSRIGFRVGDFGKMGKCPMSFQNQTSAFATLVDRNRLTLSPRFNRLRCKRLTLAPMRLTTSACPASLVSRGPGSGGAVGDGDGTGIGPGRGPGLGRGSGSGFGEGAYQPGNGVMVPTLVTQIRPNYTNDAMHRKFRAPWSSKRSLDATAFR